MSTDWNAFGDRAYFKATDVLVVYDTDDGTGKNVLAGAMLIRTSAGVFPTQLSFGALDWTGVDFCVSFKAPATAGSFAVGAYQAGTSGSAAIYRVDNAACPLQTLFFGTSPVGSITTNGTSTNYNTTSDRRLKANIGAPSDSGALIDAIEIISHDWIRPGMSRVQFGAIAQDMIAVAPFAVRAGSDSEEIDPKDPAAVWGVDWTTWVPALIEEVKRLRARVAALEVA